MGSIGVSLKIDLNKVDRNKTFKGKNGAEYLDVTAFINLDEEDQYGNNGMLTQSVNKEDKQAGIKGAILGNSKVFWSSTPKEQPAPPAPDFSQAGGDPSSETPF